MAFAGQKAFLSHTGPENTNDPVVKQLTKGAAPFGALQTTDILRLGGTSTNLVTGEADRAFTIVSHPGTTEQSASFVALTAGSSQPDGVIRPTTFDTFYISNRNDNAILAAKVTGLNSYDHIDLPPISPVVARINCHRGACLGLPQARDCFCAWGVEPGSPFGPGLCALVIHLHMTQAIGFERLVCLLSEAFGLTLSQGAAANILSRAEAPLLAAAAPIAAAVRESPVAGSDETSAQVKGKTRWQWVLLGSTAICHAIADTRAAPVLTAFMDGAQPEVWVADRCGGQQGHGATRQMCLPPCRAMPPTRARSRKREAFAAGTAGLRRAFACCRCGPWRPASDGRH